MKRIINAQKRRATKGIPKGDCQKKYNEKDKDCDFEVAQYKAQYIAYKNACERNAEIIIMMMMRSEWSRCIAPPCDLLIVATKNTLLEEFF